MSIKVKNCELEKQTETQQERAYQLDVMAEIISEYIIINLLKQK